MVAVTNAIRHEVEVIANTLSDTGYRCWKVEMRMFDPRNFNGSSIDIFDGRTSCTLIAVPEERDPGAVLDDYPQVVISSSLQ